MTDAEILCRFVAVAATALEPEVARWTAALVWRGLAPSRRRRIRDDLLREAARRLPPESAWAKAHRIAELARCADARPDVATAGGLVALAMAAYCPKRRDRDLSVHQIYRILVFGIRPMEMEVAGDAQSKATLDIFSE